MAWPIGESRALQPGQPLSGGVRNKAIGKFGFQSRFLAALAKFEVGLNDCFT